VGDPSPLRTLHVPLRVHTSLADTDCRHLTRCVSLSNGHTMTRSVPRLIFFLKQSVADAIGIGTTVASVPVLALDCRCDYGLT